MFLGFYIHHSPSLPHESYFMCLNGSKTFLMFRENYIPLIWHQWKDTFFIRSISYFQPDISQGNFGFCFLDCAQTCVVHVMWCDAQSLSHVRLFATPRTVAYQAPPSMGFSRQEYWGGLPFPSPGDLPNPGIEPGSPAFQADALTSEPPGKC